MTKGYIEEEAEGSHAAVKQLNRLTKTNDCVLNDVRAEVSPGLSCFSTK